MTKGRLDLLVFVVLPVNEGQLANAASKDQPASEASKGQLESEASLGTRGRLGLLVFGAPPVNAASKDQPANAASRDPLVFGGQMEREASLGTRGRLDRQDRRENQAKQGNGAKPDCKDLPEIRGFRVRQDREGSEGFKETLGRPEPLIPSSTGR